MRSTQEEIMVGSIKAKRTPYSEIRVMFDAARRLEEQGREVIHLEIGRPDFDTPNHIVEAVALISEFMRGLAPFPG
jgi:aspartate/methionine/tyrosine aminotransferase